jgi:hypothetical protein
MSAILMRASFGRAHVLFHSTTRIYDRRISRSAFRPSTLPVFSASKCILSNASQYFFLCGELPNVRDISLRKRLISSSSMTLASRDLPAAASPLNLTRFTQK